MRRAREDGHEHPAALPSPRPPQRSARGGDRGATPRAALEVLARSRRAADALASPVGRRAPPPRAASRAVWGCGSSAGTSTPTTGAATRRAAMLAAIGPAVTAAAEACSCTTAWARCARRRSAANTLELLPPLVGAARDAGLSVGPLRRGRAMSLFPRRSSPPPPSRPPGSASPRRSRGSPPAPATSTRTRASRARTSPTSPPPASRAGGRPRALRPRARDRDRARRGRAPTPPPRGSSTGTSTASSVWRCAPGAAARARARSSSRAGRCCSACGEPTPLPARASRRASWAPAAPRRPSTGSRRSAPAPAACDRALVSARDDGGARRLAYVDASERVVDRPQLVSRLGPARLRESPRGVPRAPGAGAPGRARRADARAVARARRRADGGDVGGDRRRDRRAAAVGGPRRPRPRRAAPCSPSARCAVAQATIDRWLDHAAPG